jgi:hypothetical protein
MTFLQAGATEEGWYVHGSRPQRNNNPGDLIWGPEAHAFGATHGDIESETGYAGYAGFAVFPDEKTGWRAYQRWYSVPAKFNGAGELIAGYLGATIVQAIYRFAPPSGNNSALYTKNVCENCGQSPTTRLTSELLATPEVP